MNNKVNICESNSSNNRDQNNDANQPQRKLLSNQYPIPESETINFQRYLKLFLLFTGNFESLFSGTVLSFRLD